MNRTAAELAEAAMIFYRSAEAVCEEDMQKLFTALVLRDYGTIEALFDEYSHPDGEFKPLITPWGGGKGGNK